MGFLNRRKNQQEDYQSVDLDLHQHDDPNELHPGLSERQQHQQYQHQTQHHNSTYILDDDDDDDGSEAPPPPPPPPETFEDTPYDTTSTSPSLDRSAMGTMQANEVSPDHYYNNTNGNTNGNGNSNDQYHQVPLTGQFRGMSKAQMYEEEEAGMDEIEVPSSSVVDRLNAWEEKYALKRRCRMLGVLIGSVVLVILAVTLGSVFGTRGGTPRGAVDGSGNGNGNGNDISDTGGNGNNNADMNLNPAAVALFPSLPSSTQKDLEEENVDSPAYKAWEWLISDTNQHYNFGDVSALKGELGQLNLKQRFALATLYESIPDEDKNSGGTSGGGNGDGEGAFDSWMSENDVCEWSGITCGGNDNDNGGGNERGRRTTRMLENDFLSSKRITSVNVSAKSLSGSIIPELSILKDMKRLIMFDNDLTGDIPEEIYSLTNLEVLDLYNNKLSGGISSKIGNLKNLVGLYLGRNQFTGVLPNEIYTNLVSLRAIWIDYIDTFDVQSLPAEIGNLVNLEQLKISGSNFAENLPAEIGSLVNLDEFLARENAFEGVIPSMENLTKLRKLDLADNYFEGELPKLRNHPEMTHLRVHGNGLSGFIPNHYGRLTKLEELLLGPNVYDGIPGSGLSEKIPEALGSLVNLKRFEVQGNLLTGEIPDIFGSMTELEHFKVQGNSLIGNVPNGVCLLRELITVEADCNVDCDCCTDYNTCSRD